MALRKSILDIVQRSHQNRANVRNEALGALMKWYSLATKLDVNDDLTLVNLCDERMPDGSIRWFIEPPAPGVRQLVVIEQEIGDRGWNIWTEWDNEIIRSVGGL